MNISSNSSDFSVEEDSSDHEDSGEERAPQSGVTSRHGGFIGLGVTFLHWSLELWVRWAERGSVAHPRVGLTC